MPPRSLGMNAGRGSAEAEAASPPGSAPKKYIHLHSAVLYCAVRVHGTGNFCKTHDKGIRWFGTRQTIPGMALLFLHLLLSGRSKATRLFLKRWMHTHTHTHAPGAVLNGSQPSFGGRCTPRRTQNPCPEPGERGPAGRRLAGGRRSAAPDCGSTAGPARRAARNE